jgi:hypothetical protein
MAMSDKENIPQQQDLKDYYRTVFTLKNGKQVEIQHEETFRAATELKNENGVVVVAMNGFITTPLIVAKSVEVMLNEIAAIETTFEPHVTWRGTELDTAGACNHPPEALCALCSTKPISD